MCSFQMKYLFSTRFLYGRHFLLRTENIDVFVIAILLWNDTDTRINNYLLDNLLETKRSVLKEQVYFENALP